MKIIIADISSKKEAEEILHYLRIAGYGGMIKNNEWDDESDDWNPEA